jgi:hypothetical protein
MPLKWKIYYWCCIYHLTWSIGFIMLIIYGICSSDDLINASAGIMGFVLIALIALAANKPLISFKFIRHLQNKTLFTPTELNVFAACFALNIAMMFFAAYLFVWGLMAYLTSNAHSFKSTMLLLSIVLFIFSCLYLLAMDRPLKRRIRERRNLAAYTARIKTAETP